MNKKPVLPPSCEGCGACCRGWDVDVLWSDLVPQRLTKDDSLLGHIMRRRAGACIALMGDGRCGIYEQRPKVCRDFERGSKECLIKLRERAATP